MTSTRLNQVAVPSREVSINPLYRSLVAEVGFLESIGRLTDPPTQFSFLSALLFSAAGIVFSVLWLSVFKSGPREWLFRKVAS